LIKHYYIPHDTMIKIGGFQKLSLLEFPGRVSAVIYVVGCNFRCPYCYVPQLVLPEKIKGLSLIPEEYVLKYLEKRAGLVDAVVVTGGEPTLQRDLPSFIRCIREIGYMIGLETNGTNPEVLNHLIKNGLVDYIEMDIKTRLVFKKYYEVTGRCLSRKNFENIKRSIKIIMNSDIDYAFRTTMLKEFHTVNDIIGICKYIKGAKKYYIQNVKTFAEMLGLKTATPFSEDEVKEIIKTAEKYVCIEYRG